MDSIFKTGQEVWFTWELDGKSHESFGTIDEIYYFNDVRKHKYKITSFSQLKQKAFYIWEDKISFYKKEDRDKLRCVDCKYNKDVISIGRCNSCGCSHRFFEKKLSYSIKKLEEAYSKAEAMCDNSEPRKVCKTCKNRECGLAYEPCRICKDHNMWESTKVNPFLLGDLVMYKDASKPDIFTVIDRLEFKDPAGNTAYSYKIKRTTNDGKIGDIVHIVDHDKLVKIQFKGGYEYKRGDIVRFEYDGFIKVGKVIELLYADTDRGALYKIKGKDTGNEYLVNQGRIKGFYGDFNSFKPEAHSNTADSLKRKLEEAYLKAETMYGLNFNQTFYDDILKYVNEDKMSINDIRKSVGMEPIKEDNMKNTKLIRSNGTYKKEIKNVIFSGPVTTVVFEDEFDIAFGRVIKSKTNVRCQEGDEFDKTTGFLLALVKTFVDKQSYDNILRTIDGFEEDKIEKHVKYTRKHIKLEKKCEDDWKFMAGDLVRLKSGNVIFKVVRTLTWNYNDKVIHRYAIQRLGGSKYTTYENENRLTLVEPTTGRLMKSIIKE